ncbi:bifunctional TENA-E protein { [Artemisia annua]|uniref:Bifunctional TENA-E protein () n=1 Tax=Artemisia annua TaxID=35608 RepID=A0A2U1LWU8_ARTAN|nr:bifunctional TENA-E protein { [Artemisia annua]
MAALEVAEVIEEYTHESLTFRDAVACEVISKWMVVMKEDMDTRSSMCMLSNRFRRSSDDSSVYYWKYAPDYMGFTYESKAEIWVTKDLLDEAKENILGMEIFRTQSVPPDILLSSAFVMVPLTFLLSKNGWTFIRPSFSLKFPLEATPLPAGQNRGAQGQDYIFVRSFVPFVASTLIKSYGNKIPQELQETCERWGNEGFGSYCKLLRNISDRCLQKGSPDVIAKVEFIFHRVLEHEVEFWNMSFGEP